jgi:hypothetical protein
MICREAHAVRIVFSAILLGLAMMVGAVASLESYPPYQSEQHAAVIVHGGTLPQHDCPTSSGSLAGHCQLPSAVLGAGSGNLSGSTGAFENNWILPDLLRRTQHRPSGLLRPPNALSRRA